MNHAIRPSRGFTIIELLVASAVTIILLVLIGQMFTATTNAVSQGAARSDIIANSDTFVTQLSLDAQAMVGPHDNDSLTAEEAGGILIIVNHRIPNVRYPLPGAGEAIRPFVRSDQLVFIRTRDPDAYPLAPNSSSSFTPHDDEGLAPFSRVWYGHVVRTNPDGTGGGTLGTGQEVLLTSWLLGRQELFLAKKATGLPGAPAPATLHANGAFYNAPVVGIGGAPAPAELYQGWTDYAYAGLYDTQADPHTNGAIVGHASGTYGSNSLRRLWANLPVVTYRTQAIQDYSFAMQRLRVNPVPNSATPEYWQVAQMHPLFIEHCSDFIVEWAGDTDLDGQLDTVSAAEAALVQGAGGVMEEGAIKWYAHWTNVPGPGFEPLAPVVYAPPSGYHAYTSSTGAPHANAGFVWRHDDEPTLAVPNGKFTNDPDQPSFWPYLIRIRYRLHDARGQLMSGDAGTQNMDQVHGVWFEHVMRVNRPNP